MSGPRTRRPGELVFVICITGFAGVAFWQAYLISGFTSLSAPGIFPMLATGAMLLSGIFVVREVVAGSRPLRAGGDAAAAFRTLIAPTRLIGLIGLVVVYIWVMPWLGFMASSGAFLFASFAFLWRKNIFVLAGLTAITLGFIYIVFRLVFQVVLPQGTLLQGLI